MPIPDEFFWLAGWDEESPPAPCPTPTDPAQDYTDCGTEDPTVPGDGSYEVIDDFSAFGDAAPDPCSIYILDPGYDVVDELIDGCCECPCVPSGTTQLHATISSDGACGWSGTIVLNLINPRLAPKDTACWTGSILGSNGCTLFVSFCCNCNGIKGLIIGTSGPNLCGDDCCTFSGTCAPLDYTGTFCCHWKEGVGVDCGSCCVTVEVTL